MTLILCPAQVVLPPSQSVSTSGTAPGEPLSPWEGMVRVSLLRMLADEVLHQPPCADPQ